MERLCERKSIDNVSVNTISFDGKISVFYYDYLNSNEPKDSELAVLSKTVDGVLMAQYRIGYGIEEMDNFDQQALTNKYLMVINNNKEISILFSSRSVLKLLETSGINEPVNEALVTHEDNKLTIYFMNKDSIFRWQNSEEGIQNLKLRKLDLKPEPIKTIQTN
jgi:hypothetical protein